MQTWSQNRITIQSWQAAPLADFDLTEEDGMAQVWLVESNGRLFGGAQAINRALRFVWWAKPFTYLYNVPGIRPLQDWIYQWVVVNRYRLPGSTASCKINPRDPTTPHQ